MKIGNLTLDKGKLFTILGPCVIENEEMTMGIAGSLKKISEETGIDIIFKASFDKANRSSIKSYRGPGIDEGLRILKKIKDET
ncbi:MAG: 3-deoxy-8-phosphooctulonate synthase, partial [Acidobacteriota bacterium]